jgi:acyl-ACP thioesterase
VQSYDFEPIPAQGRVWRHDGLRVRLGEVTPSGRLRLDALAGALQDAATDDADEALPTSGEAKVSQGVWILRRLVLGIGELPSYQQHYSVRTWCGGIGARWAERRTDLLVGEVAQVRAAAIWVHIDAATGRPIPLPDAFTKVYGPAAAGRAASQRLHLPGPASSNALRVPWQVRASDFDVLGHVNNAAYFHALEELLATRSSRHGRIHQVEAEWRAGIDPRERVELATADTGPEVRVWLLVDGVVRATLFAALRR